MADDRLIYISGSAQHFQALMKRLADGLPEKKVVRYLRAGQVIFSVGVSPRGERLVFAQIQEAPKTGEWIVLLAESLYKGERLIFPGRQETLTPEDRIARDRVVESPQSFEYVSAHAAYIKAYEEVDRTRIDFLNDNIQLEPGLEWLYKWIFDEAKEARLQPRTGPEPATNGRGQARGKGAGRKPTTDDEKRVMLKLLDLTEKLRSKYRNYPIALGHAYDELTEQERFMLPNVPASWDTVRGWRKYRKKSVE